MIATPRLHGGPVDQGQRQPTPRTPALTPLPACPRCAPRDVAHLAAWTGVVLAVEVEAGAGLGGQLQPAVRLLADQVHHLCVAVAPGGAQRPAGHGADVVLELAHRARLDGPMA